MAYSGQERIAFNRGLQDGILGRGKDNPYDQQVVPRSFFAYEDGYGQGEISELPPRGPVGPQGDKGDQGSQGIPGLPGQDGGDGLSLFQGSGAPVDGVTVPVESKPGDKYIDNTDRGALYVKTDATTWTFQANLVDVTLASQVDDTGGSPQVIYQGEAATGAVTSDPVWRIRRLTITTDVGGNDDIATEWADGNALFDNVWDNRASLSYS